MSGSLMFPRLLSHIHVITLAIVRKVVHIEAHDSADDAIIGYKHKNGKNTYNLKNPTPFQFETCPYVWELRISV